MALTPDPDELAKDQEGFQAFLHDLPDEELVRTLTSCQFVAQFGIIDDTWMLQACNVEIRRRGLEVPEPKAKGESPASTLLPRTDP